jgi:1,4-dihydroxy-2-naphthoate octaprenyltransferase
VEEPSTQTGRITSSEILPAVVLIVIFAIYSLAVLSLDYTFSETGFSPFDIWSPIQTAYFAIVGLGFLSLLILYESQNHDWNIKGVLHILPVMALSFLLIFSIDTRQVTQYDFTIHTVVSVLIGPIVLGTPLAFGISICYSAGIAIIPGYGEGTIGSILVVSVILSMYITAKTLNYMRNRNLDDIKSIKPLEIVKFGFELLVAYICIVAGFSLIGGLVTDGTPPPLLIPFNIVLLGFYTIIPFSLLLVRHKLISKSRI